MVKIVINQKKMPKPYSKDLRERVLKVVDEKKIMSMQEISEMFNIDRKTLYRWRKRKEETGSIEAITGYQKGHRSKIKNLDSFIKFLEYNQDVTVDKIIEKFGKMCKNTVYNYFKKVGYTYKKNLSLSREE